MLGPMPRCEMLSGSRNVPPAAPIRLVAAAGPVPPRCDAQGQSDSEPIPRQGHVLGQPHEADSVTHPSNLRLYSCC